MRVALGYWQVCGHLNILVLVWHEWKREIGVAENIRPTFLLLKTKNFFPSSKVRVVISCYISDYSICLLSLCCILMKTTRFSMSKYKWDLIIVKSKLILRVSWLNHASSPAQDVVHARPIFMHSRVFIICYCPILKIHFDVNQEALSRWHLLK